MYFNATALTLTNISKVLEGVDWETLCQILEISNRKRDELASLFPDTDQREEAIKFWMTSDPIASWRRLVNQLYSWGQSSEYKDLLPIADSVRHYCKDLTGMCIHITPHHDFDTSYNYLTHYSTHVCVCLMTMVIIKLIVCHINVDLGRELVLFIGDDLVCANTLAVCVHHCYNHTFIIISGRR